MTKSNIIKWALTLVIGSFIFTFSTSCNRTKGKGPTDTPKSGNITIAVDESVKELISQEIEVFQSTFPQAHIQPIYSDELNVINQLLADSLKLIITNRPLTPAEKNGLMNRFKLEARQTIIGRDAIAVIANKSNPDSLISFADLHKILEGKYQKWNDLYPQSRLGNIQLVFDNKNSGAIRYAIDSINNGHQIQNKNVFAAENPMEVIKHVSETPNALGMLGVNWVLDRADTTNMTFSKNIRVMFVAPGEKAELENSFQPYQAYLYTDRYPLTRNIYSITTDPRNGLAWGFQHFLMDQKGQLIILKEGLMPAMQAVRIVSVKSE